MEGNWLYGTCQFEPSKYHRYQIDLNVGYDLDDRLCPEAEETDQQTEKLGMQ